MDFFLSLCFSLSSFPLNFSRVNSTVGLSTWTTLQSMLMHSCIVQNVVFISHCLRHFDYEIWYIKHCTEELRGIRELLPRSRNKITAIRKEMELLRATVHLLHGQTDNSLTRIDRLFMDSDPKEGVGKSA